MSAYISKNVLFYIYICIYFILLTYQFILGTIINTVGWTYLYWNDFIYYIINYYNNYFTLLQYIYI